MEDKTREQKGEDEGRRDQRKDYWREQDDDQIKAQTELRD